MFSLLRRDPSLRMVPKWILVSAMTTSAIAGMRAWLVASRALQSGTLDAGPRSVDSALFVIALWAPLALFLAFGRVGQRCSRFDLVMPLAAKRLWSAHWLGMLVSGSLILAASAGVLSLHERLLARFPRYVPGAGYGLGTLALIAGAAMLLVAAILQSTQPSLYRVHVDGRRRWLVLGALSFGLVLILGLSSLPLAATIVPVVLALVIGAMNYRAVPAVLALAPHAPEEATETARVESWSDLYRSTGQDPGARVSWLQRVRLDASVFRILQLGIAPGQMLRLPVNVIAFPFLFGMGMLLGGIVTRYDVLRYTNITLAVYMLAAFVGGPMMQLYILDPLPISRRRIFALLMLPNLLAVAVGYGAARIGLAQMDAEPSVAYRIEASESLYPGGYTSAAMVRVPASAFRIAWDGRPPRSDSSWGESQEAWGIPLFRGSRAVIYSPFSTGEESSIDFAALQLGRAVEAVHGVSIPFEEIRDRFLEVSPEGAVRLKTSLDPSLLSDLPGAHEYGKGPVFPVVLALTAVLWFLLASVYFRVQRASTSEGARKAAFFGMLGVAIGLHLIQFFFFIADLVEDWVVLALFEMVIRWIAWTFPGGSIAVWIVLSALAIAAAYRWARGAFERVEIVVAQPRREC